MAVVTYEHATSKTLCKNGRPDLSILSELREIVAPDVIAPGDTMYAAGWGRHYFYVGRSNLLTLMNVANIRACYPGGETPIQHIFDFGCGFGRVTRWIRAGFPDAKVYVTDYDKAGVAWCVEQYGCIDAGQDITPDTYDMIWLGSVFTHLASDVVEPLMQRLLRSLRPNGVLVITSQGRFAEKRIEAFDWTNDEKAFVHYGLKKELTDILLEDYNRTGYGYVDYPGQKGYGVCIAKSQWYTDRVTSSPDYIHILSQEKGSDNHQDVNAYMRANLLDEEKGPLW